MHKARTYVPKYKYKRFGLKWNLPGGDMIFLNIFWGILVLYVLLSPDPSDAIPLFNRSKKRRSQK
ncbi:hypothetical protein [Cytobacillus firmus]|uniref:hypothetical protein n=1 Tax=Cytobacillus firmus TaxID=1399 RepID=UPI0021AD9BA3|nr:hypothetical protein [Cytobacillus firmus]